ncbi:RNA-binding protein 44 isoform X2 [Trichomycterus rosablanca]
MWYPPSVLVPIYLEQSSRRATYTSTTMMWPVLPLEQNVCLSMNEIDHPNHRLSIEDGRKFLLNKSVFDLVKVSQYLELTDPKLLGWYLSLPVEDRKLIQEEGGLLRFLQIHPALEVSRHIVHLKQQILGNCSPVTDMSSKQKSRQATHYGVLQCLNCSTTCPSSAKQCYRCNLPILNVEENISMSEEEKTLRLLPNNVREELNLLKAKGHDIVWKPRQLDCCQNSNLPATRISSLNRQQVRHQQKNSNGEQKLCQLWKDGMWHSEKDDRKYKDPSAQASFSLDRELEMQSQGINPGDIVSAGDSADFTNLDEETMPEYYSFNSTIPEHTSAQWGDPTDVSVTATKCSTEATTVDQPVEDSAACSTENGIFPESVSYISNSSEWTDFTEDCQEFNRDELKSGTETDKYHSMMEEVQVQHNQTSINTGMSRSAFGAPVSQSTCADAKKTQCKKSKASLTVNQAVNASSDFRACFTFTRATEIDTNFFVKPTQDVSAGTDLLINHDQGTQTVQRFTSEKCTVTEVYMSDLDAICEEFGKLKVMEEELKHLKSRMARSGLGSTRRPESERQKSCCDAAVSRATQAELRLLALQFVMCKQHCWRRFYTSPLGETALQGAEVLPGIMSQTLKSLENNYLEMKKMIQEGVPLDNLKPLSVDTVGTTEETCYSPALIFAASLEDVVLETQSSPSTKSVDGSQTDETDAVLKMETIDGGPPGKNTPPQRKSGSSSKSVGGKRSRAVSILSQQSGVSGDTKSGNPKDLNGSEAWFDAEEHLGADNLGCKEDHDVEQRASEESKKKQGATDEMEDESSLLCVTNLPSSVTERDLMHLFERYPSSQLCTSTFGKNR